jgi:hypothetical protein
MGKCGKILYSGRATDDNIARRMHTACCIHNATDTHSKYEILATFPLQQWLQEIASILCYTYIASIFTKSGVLQRK